jgi:hypothetical protein
MFNDITALLLRPAAFKDAVDMFVERYRGMRIAAVAGKHYKQPYVQALSQPNRSNHDPLRGAFALASPCAGGAARRRA